MWRGQKGHLRVSPWAGMRVSLVAGSRGHYGRFLGLNFSPAFPWKELSVSEWETPGVGERGLLCQAQGG